MKIENKIFTEERSLYGLKDSTVYNCIFEGGEDGESPLKETNNIEVIDSKINLRYPLWHNHNSVIKNTKFPDNSRASYWYSTNGKFENIELNSVKFLRECSNISIYNSVIESIEFVWRSKEIYIESTNIDSVYPFFEVDDLKMDKVTMKGKYSLQYDNNVLITNSYLNTKDAFWHSRNVVVIDSVVEGEYLAWYAEDITFINCKIIGTQPFCYSKNIKLINCTFDGCDLAFENTTFEVDCPLGEFISIKNPISGTIKCKKIGEVIVNEYKIPGEYKIIENK